MAVFPYKHIIWDWNGTLFDDAWLCVEVMNGLLRRRGMSLIDSDIYQTLFDFPVIDYYRKIGFDLSTEPFEAISTEFITAYEARRSECGLRSGVIEVLKRNQHKGFDQSILSAAKQEFLYQAVDEFGIADFFSHVNGVDDHHAFGKVELGKSWAATLDLDLGDLVLIGDTVHDYEVAGEIGVDCYLVPGGHQSRERLTASGAKVLPSHAALYEKLIADS